MTLTERLLSSDTLYDAKRFMETYESLDDQYCDEYNKLLDGRNKQNDYQRALRILLTTAGMKDPLENVTANEINKHLEARVGVDPDYQSFVCRHVLSKDAHKREMGNILLDDRQHKRERNNVIEIDEDEHDSGDDDLQYEAFFRCLKEHGNSYVLENDNNGSPMVLAYEEEEEGSSDDARRRKITRNGFFEQIKGTNQHVLEMRPRTSVISIGKGPQKDFIVREKDRRVGLRGKKKLDSRARDVEFLGEKIVSTGSSLNNRSDLRLRSVSKGGGGDNDTNPQHNGYVNFVVTSSDAENSGGVSDWDQCKRLSQKDFTMMEKDSNVCLRGMKKLDSRATNECDNNVEDDESVDFMMTASDSKKCIELEYSSREDTDDSDSDYKKEESLSSDEDIRMSRPGCSKWADNLLKTRKVGPLLPMPPPMEFEEMEKGEFERAVSREKNMLRDQTRNLEKSVKGKEVFKGYYESNKKAVVRKNKGHSYMRRSPRFNLVTEGQSKNVVDKEHLGQEKIMKEIKGKRVVLEDTLSKTKANKWFNEQEAAKNQKMLKKMVKQDKMIAEPKRRSVVRLGSELAHQKRGPVMKCVDRIQPDKEESAESRSKSKKEVKEENVIRKCKKKISENESDDMEIIDSAAILRERKYSSFVPNKIDTICGPRVCSDYRRRVLKVLKKPFDKQEYVKLSEEVKVYLEQYPGLKKKLVMYRYKREKRLTILRGFFFWIQNVTCEGAFRPWKDRQCIVL